MIFYPRDGVPVSGTACAFGPERQERGIESELNHGSFSLCAKSQASLPRFCPRARWQTVTHPRISGSHRTVERTTGRQLGCQSGAGATSGFMIEVPLGRGKWKVGQKKQWTERSRMGSEGERKVEKMKKKKERGEGGRDRIGT